MNDTTLVARYCSTISLSPPWPLTRVMVMPVTPARKSALFTSASRSGRITQVMSFIAMIGVIGYLCDSGVRWLNRCARLPVSNRIA